MSRPRQRRACAGEVAESKQRFSACRFPRWQRPRRAWTHCPTALQLEGQQQRTHPEGEPPRPIQGWPGRDDTQPGGQPGEGGRPASSGALPQFEGEGAGTARRRRRRVPFQPSSHHALSRSTRCGGPFRSTVCSASRTSLLCPVPFRTLQRKSSSSSDIPLHEGKSPARAPQAKKKRELSPPLSPPLKNYAYCIISRCS